MTNLPQGKRRANLQQASRLANLGQGLRQPITVEGAVRHLAGVDTAVRIVEVNWCSAQAAKGGFWGCKNYPKCKHTEPDAHGEPRFAATE